MLGERYLTIAVAELGGIAPSVQVMCITCRSRTPVGARKALIRTERGWVQPVPPVFPEVPGNVVRRVVQIYSVVSSMRMATSV